MLGAAPLLCPPGSCFLPASPPRHLAWKLPPGSPFSAGAGELPCLSGAPVLCCAQAGGGEAGAGGDSPAGLLLAPVWGTRPTAAALTVCARGLMTLPDFSLPQESKTTPQVRGGARPAVGGAVRSRRIPPARSSPDALCPQKAAAGRSRRRPLGGSVASLRGVSAG